VRAPSTHFYDVALGNAVTQATLARAGGAPIARDFLLPPPIFLRLPPERAGKDGLEMGRNSPFSRVRANRSGRGKGGWWRVQRVCKRDERENLSESLALQNCKVEFREVN